MAANKILLSDEEFATLYNEKGAAHISRQFQVSTRNVFVRKTKVETKLGITLVGPNGASSQTVIETKNSHPHRYSAEVKNGYAIIAGDCHYWPGEPSTAHRALVHLIKELRPQLIVINGDVLDASTISRHPPIGWENRPSLIDEIEVAQDRLDEIVRASSRAAKKVWTLGNHDARFETRLASVAPEFARLNGVHLKDHFPSWHAAWSTWINDDVVVKHRFKGGIHAPHNNTIWAGRTIITGHLHSQKVIPFTDYNGTRYGVDCGTIADVGAKAFVDYTEDNPLNWRAGFCVLRFIGHKLLMPQLVSVWDENHVQYCGELIKV